MNQQTIADVMDIPKAKITNDLPFISASDPDLKKEWCLIDGLGREMSVLYICPRTGHFLASDRLSQSKRINPLEYDKNGVFVGFSKRYNIVSKRRL